MSDQDKNNEERPYETLNELLTDYGYKDSELAEAEKQLNFVRSVLALKRELESSFFDSAETGKVYSIQAPWGMGKTSYINILQEQISKSGEINPQYLCYYYYDSLYYGDISEAIKTILTQLFKRIENRYAIKLRGVQNIARNLTPGLELSVLFAKVNFIRAHQDTNSIISEKIKGELRNITGKIYVVIDDIDRLTSTEALHLLRLVRLLRGLPNTYIFLPLDYDALIKMLAEEHIANPGGYVRKIITEPIRLPATMNDPRIFFQKNCLSILDCEDTAQAQENLRDLWMGYLWELSQLCISRLQKADPPLRYQMSTPASDATWEQAEDLLNVSGNNFILDFFEDTRRSYDETLENEYLVKFKVRGSNPEIYRYYRYGFMAPQTTFLRFVNGNYNENYVVTQLGGGLDMTCGRDLFNLEVYKESDVIEITGRAKTNAESDFYEADQSMSEKLEGKKLTFWDLLLQEIPDDSMPQSIFKHVSPRMIKRLIIEIKRSDIYSSICDEIKSPRSGTNSVYRLARDIIRQFVEEYAVE